MQAIFKVVLIVLSCAISSYSRPLHPSSEKNYNNTPELSRNFFRTRNGYGHNPDIPRHSSFTNNLGRRSSEKFNSANEMKKRNLDIGIHVKDRTPQPEESELEAQLERFLADALANGLGAGEKKPLLPQDCPSCEEEIIERVIQPAYPCDDWDTSSRMCILERNVGDTVTFYLSTGKEEVIHRPNVTWKKEFHMRNSKERREYKINPLNPPENTIIGNKGFEFRISPITETDIEYNIFSATLHSHGSFKSTVYFMIRIAAIDLSFVYVGESIYLDLHQFVSLPEQSVSYKWYMEKDGEHGTLPSNMKISDTGSSIKIAELRQEQEGILACSVYTNLNILATKKRFLIKDLSKNKDVLQIKPNYTLLFKDEFRMKRGPKKLSPYLSFLVDSMKKRRVVRTVNVDGDDYKSVAGEPLNGPENLGRITDEEFPLQDGFQEEIENIPDKRPFINQPQYNMQMNPESAYRNGQKDGFFSKSQESPVDYVPPKNVPSKVQNSLFSDISNNNPNMQQNQNSHQSANQKKGKQYVDMDIEDKGSMPSQLEELSDIALDIGLVQEPYKVTAEMEIAKLISYCNSEYECSYAATCVKEQLKVAGFCKCFPGTSGVGLFCREEIQLNSHKLSLT